MSANTFHFVSDDLLPSFDFIFEQEDDNGVVTPIDLSIFSSIKLRMRRDDGVLIVIDHTVIDGPNGKGEFQWGAGDLTPGIHRAEIRRIRVAGALPQTIPSVVPFIFDTRDLV